MERALSISVFLYLNNFKMSGLCLKFLNLLMSRNTDLSSFALLEHEMTAACKHQDALFGLAMLQQQVANRWIPFAPRFVNSKPLSGIMAISSRRPPVSLRFVWVLIRIRVLFFHQRVVISAVLGTGRQAVPALPSSFVVVIFIRGH